VLEVGLRQNEATNPDQCIKIAKMKAAAIEADMYLGALFGGGKGARIDVLSRFGRIVGILATLRDEFIDVFEVDELRQRISAQSLPTPILFAMVDEDVRATVLSLVSRPKISRKDADRLLDIVLEAKTVKSLKNHMHVLFDQAKQLAESLLADSPDAELRKEFQLLLDFMLEDL
jgi:geranylgeranyl pyrophosphate synthase